MSVWRRLSGAVSAARGQSSIWFARRLAAVWRALDPTDSASVHFAQLAALRILLAGYAMISSAFLIWQVLFLPTIWIGRFEVICLVGALVAAYFWTDRPSRMKSGGWLLAAAALLCGFVISARSGGVDGVAAPVMLLAPMAAGFFVGWRALVGTAMAVVAAYFILAVLEHSGLVAPSSYPDGMGTWVTFAVLSVVALSIASATGAVTASAQVWRRRREAQNRFQTLLAATKSETQRLFLANEPRAAFDCALDGLKKLTRSEYGFIGEVLHDVGGAPYLKTHAITNIAWNQETHRHFDQFASEGLEFRNLATLFGAAITTKAPVFANTAPADARAGGVPPGHPPLNTFLGAPFLVGDELLGMVGLANRPEGYSAALLDSIKPVLDMLARLIVLMRERAATDRAQAALAELYDEREAALTHVRSYQAALDKNAMVSIVSADGRVLFSNDGIVETLGFTQEELLEEEIRKFNAHFQDEALVASAMQALRSGQVFRAEVSARTRDGAVKWLDTTIVPELDVRGELERFVIIRYDVTERRETQMALAKTLADLQAERASLEARVLERTQDLQRSLMITEAANNAKSDFLAMISHELRTPLHTIRSYSEVLAEDIDAGVSDHLRADVSEILIASDHLLALVNDLLDISKAEAGQLLARRQEFRLGDMVAEVAAAMGPLAKKGANTLVVECEDETVLCDTDRIKLKQCLLNLVSNAAKFTVSGQIALRAAVRMQSGAPWLSIEVSDTGCGMPEDVVERLFQPFLQVDSSFTRKHNGAGLGLFITKQICELLGGGITARSVLGEGSAFTICIPAQLPLGEQAQPMALRA